MTVLCERHLVERHRRSAAINTQQGDTQRGKTQRGSTQRDYLSFTAISTYQQCPLKYFYRYIERLPEREVSANLVLGSAIHAAIELHFRELLSVQPPPDQDQLLEQFWHEWNERGSLVSIRFGRHDDLNSIGRLADRMLAVFRESELAHVTGSILGIEESFRDKIVDDAPDLLAKIDLLVETEHTLKVIDFKTARSRWNAKQAQRSADQLLLYSELVQPLVPRKPIELEFAVLTKTAQPHAECFTVTYSRKRVERMRSIIRHVWSAIYAGHFYPAPSPMNCPTCPYRSECRRWPGSLGTTTRTR